MSDVAAVAAASMIERSISSPPVGPVGIWRRGRQLRLRKRKRNAETGGAEAPPLAARSGREKRLPAVLPCAFPCASPCGVVSEALPAQAGIFNGFSSNPLGGLHLHR
jgi:hypothetical protein